MGVKGAIYRAVITVGCLAFKAYTLLVSIIKTIYRKTVTHNHLLEWMTSEESEKQIDSEINLLGDFMSFLKKE